MQPALVRCTVAAALVAVPAAAQLEWAKSPANPVLVHAATFPEGLAIGQPAVLQSGGELRLWYTGAGLDARGRILGARSSDGGVTWRRVNGGAPVLDTGPAGAWDEFTVDTPEAVADAGGYTLYYYGAASRDSAGAAIGAATSADGLVFVRSGTAPVLGPGPAGSWDERWVESPAVVWIPEQGRYLMWYAAVDAGWLVRIGLATSSDGITWVKHGGNPVLDVGPPGSWEDAWVGVPGVIRWRGGFLMVYAGVSAADLADGVIDDVGVGVAVSSDGIAWRRLGGGPILSTTSPPYDPAVDDGGPWAPDLAWDPARRRLLMLYETAAGFGLATSPLALARRSRGRVLPSAGAPAGRDR